jgi:hypothetical protein
MSYMKKCKLPKVVRDYLAERQRKYRARKKAREAQALQTETSHARKTPVKGAVHSENK